MSRAKLARSAEKRNISRLLVAAAVASVQNPKFNSSMFIPSRTQKIPTAVPGDMPLLSVQSVQEFDSIPEDPHLRASLMVFVRIYQVRKNNNRLKCIHTVSPIMSLKPSPLLKYALMPVNGSFRFVCPNIAYETCLHR